MQSIREDTHKKSFFLKVGPLRGWGGKPLNTKPLGWEGQTLSGPTTKNNFFMCVEIEQNVFLVVGPLKTYSIPPPPSSLIVAPVEGMSPLGNKPYSPFEYYLSRLVCSPGLRVPTSGSACLPTASATVLATADLSLLEAQVKI